MNEMIEKSQVQKAFTVISNCAEKICHLSAFSPENSKVQDDLMDRFSGVLVLSKLENSLGQISLSTIENPDSMLSSLGNVIGRNFALRALAESGDEYSERVIYITGSSLDESRAAYLSWCIRFFFYLELNDLVITYSMSHPSWVSGSDSLIEVFSSENIPHDLKFGFAPLPYSVRVELI